MSSTAAARAAQLFRLTFGMALLDPQQPGQSLWCRLIRMAGRSLSNSLISRVLAPATGALVQLQGLAVATGLAASPAPASRW